LAVRAAASSPTEQLHELFNGEPGVRDDAAQGAGSEPLMVGNNGSGVRYVAAEYHVASGLAAKDEPGALEGGTSLKAG
jgi:hypothetical protein